MSLQDAYVIGIAPASVGSDADAVDGRPQVPQFRRQEAIHGDAFGFQLNVAEVDIGSVGVDLVLGPSAHRLAGIFHPGEGLFLVGCVNQSIHQSPAS